MMKRYGKLVLFPAASIAALIAAFFSACSPANRLSRLLDRNPDLQSVQVDSFFTPGEIQVDTLYSFSADTFHLGSDTFVCRTDTIRLAERCRPGTFTKTKTLYLPVNKGPKPTKEPKRPVRERTEKVKRPTLGERIDQFFTYVFIFIVGYAFGSIMQRLSRK
jgi:hypothetical protein